MIVNETFPAIQGEGLMAGIPVYFVRLAGCNTQCDFCDTKYHTDGLYLDNECVSNEIRDSNLEDIVFTGGEPMIQMNDIREVMSYLPTHTFHLETNGSIYSGDAKHFNHISCSPKKQQINNKNAFELDSYKKFNELGQTTFKFVYENKDNQWWINFMNKVGIEKNKVWIMPEGATRNEQIKKMPEVMEYCLKNKFNFGPRLHVLAYDNQRGV